MEKAPGTEQFLMKQEERRDGILLSQRMGVPVALI
jgi:hypothetical protein